MFVVFALMYLHARRQRAMLELSTDEATTAEEQVSNCLIMAGVGLFSVLLALALPSPWAGPIAGSSYFLIGPLQYVNARRYEKKRATPGSNASEPGA